MQAVCDSLVFDSRDTCMTMYKDPILWNGDVQLLGEVVKVYMKDSSIDWVNILNQTLYAEKLDSTCYNQIRGKEMRFYFTEGELNEMQVIGSVEQIFYPVDEGKGFLGMNTMTAGKTVVYHGDDKYEVTTKDGQLYFSTRKITGTEYYITTGEVVVDDAVRAVATGYTLQGGIMKLQGVKCNNLL